MRGFAALSGVLATIVVPQWLENRKEELSSLSQLALHFLYLQVLCLAPVTIAIYYHPSTSAPKLLWIIVVGLVVSRFALWGHDLVSTQVMQEWVENAVAGEVNAMQHALISIMFLASYLLAIVFPQPEHFIYPSIVSFGGLLLAVVFYRKFHSTFGILGPPHSRKFVEDVTTYGTLNGKG